MPMMWCTTFDRFSRKAAWAAAHRHARLLGRLKGREGRCVHGQVRAFSAVSSVAAGACSHPNSPPRDYMERVGDEAFSRQPIGCGPFRYVEGRLDDKIVMERFDGYYGGSPMLPPVGTARVKRAIFRMMPDPTVRVAALKTGEVHIIQAAACPCGCIADARQEYPGEVCRGYSRLFRRDECTRPPFDDLRVRRAINYAVDWTRS